MPATKNAYDPQKFILKAKAFEREFCNSAISKAKQLAQSNTDVMVHTKSRKICNEAFNNFKDSLQAAFPNDEYQDLIYLTLKSRENLFFIDLKDQVLITLRNPAE